jgi:hypothetical protein
LIALHNAAIGLLIESIIFVINSSSRVEYSYHHHDVCVLEVRTAEEDYGKYNTGRAEGCQ